MTKHSLLSPSSAHRWLRCPASVELSRSIPDKTSVYAEEGTLAHKLAANKLEKDFILSQKEYKRIKEEPLYDKEMEYYTDKYVDKVNEIKNYRKNPSVLVEMQIELDSIAPDMFGTIDCLIVGKNTLDIIDFKYGRYTEIAAKNNPQLMLYAYGALKWIRKLEPKREIKHIRTHIFQPRMNNYSSSEVTEQELKLWIMRNVKPQAEKILSSIESEPMCGDWCMNCPALAVCKNCSERYDLKIIPNDPRVLSYEQIAQLITELDNTTKYLKKLKDFALEQAKDGVDIPGYKLVEGRSNRQWADTEEVIARSNENNINALKSEVISPPKLEKQLGKKEFAELFGDLVVKPKGKPTLATLADKRDVYQ